MRYLVVALLPLLAAPAAQAAFGSGDFAVVELQVPGDSAAEPTIGIPWNTDSVFYYPTSFNGASSDPQALPMRSWRADFDATDVPTWTEVTPPYLVPTNLDPMLVADPDTGRVFVGGLFGPCSNMLYSDDDGATWLSTINMCSGKDFDHQSIGLGPPTGPIPGVQEGRHVGYYCAQFGTVSCARSLDEGTTWGPFQQVPGSCGGFHGHIRVSPMTGFVAVPTSSCGEHSGYIATADGGLTWTSNEVEMSAQWTNGFDPSVQFSRPSGWMYYAMTSEHGVYIGLSKDEGASWQPLGAGMGITPTTWLDVGQFHDPPILSGVFTNVQAGDDERAALAFLGLEGGPGKNETLLRSNGIFRCDRSQSELVWHYYVAVTYDAGSTWAVHKLSQDPVQVGGVYDSIVGGGGGCRNLLDFQDMDIDSRGRIHIGWADGCTGECATSADPVNATGYRDTAPRLYRQTSGNGLFAEFDLAPPPVPEPMTAGEGSSPTSAPGEDTPALGALPLLGVLAVAFVLRRRR